MLSRSIVTHHVSVTSVARPHAYLPRLRRGLTGVALSATLLLTLAGGDGAQPAAAQTDASATGHAQVIAQAVLDLEDDSLAWTVAEIAAGERPTSLATNGAPGFVIGIDGAAVVRTAAGARTRLAGGEALAVRPDAGLTVQAAGSDPASLALLTLDLATGDDLGAAIAAGKLSFPSPGGTHDIELVADVLAEGETTEIAAGATPTLVLVTGGSVALEAGAGETRAVDSGETALVSGDVVVTGTAADPARFVAAVIGAGLDATEETASSDEDAESGTSGSQTSTQQTPDDPDLAPDPRASDSPSPRPDPADSPSPSDAPTAEEDGPDAERDGDDLVTGDDGPAGLDPLNSDSDSDGDGLADIDEINVYLTDPTKPDTDGEGLWDATEVLDYGTNPLVPDTDGDSLDDYGEIFYVTNPLVADTDGDTLWDGNEIAIFATDPLRYDMDGDGISDGDEVLSSGTNPANPDSDSDGLTDAEEAFLGTYPWDSDSDNDSFSDGAEIYVHRTWPLDSSSHPPIVPPPPITNA